MISQEKKREIDLAEYWRLIVKRKWVVIAFAGALVFFTGLFSFLATPLYRSTVTLLIEEETSKILSLEETFGFQSQYIQDLRYYYTQLKLLKSKSLAERVVKKLDLSSRPALKAKENPKKKPENEPSGLLPPSNPNSDLASIIQNGIDVKPVRDTRLVELSYVSSSPLLAAEIANALAEEFITFSIEKRYATTQQASDFLGEQIINLREDLAAKERELQRYGQEKDLIYLSNTESTTANKYAELYSEYTKAQIERIRAEVGFREIKDLDVESIPQSINNPMLQDLRTEYTRKKNEYEEKSKQFKPDYPEMIQLKAGLDSMKEELKRTVETANTEYQASLKRETSLKNLLDQQRVSLTKMNSNAILYDSLRIEVQQKRDLLNSLVKRQQETQVSSRLGGLKASNSNIIDRGEVPKSPFTPRKKLNLILALVIGLFGGVGLSFLFDYLDNTIKGPEDIEKIAGLPSLGIIPYLSLNPTRRGKKKYASSGRHEAYGQENRGTENSLQETEEVELINQRFPNLSISEDYRTVRTSILLSQADNPPKTIVFTSAMPQEGKTVTVVNTAVSFSQLESRVLIIEADLRKPRLHRIFKARNMKGLSSYLTGKISLKDAIQKTSIENIWLLPCGPIPPNPAELLGSKRMRELTEEFKEIFEIILIDSPPVLPVTDAVVLSSFVDGTVMVVRAGSTIRKPFLQAIEELRRAKAKIIGVLFNESKLRNKRYYQGKPQYYKSQDHMFEGKDNKDIGKITL